MLTVLLLLAAVTLTFYIKSKRIVAYFESAYFNLNQDFDLEQLYLFYQSVTLCFINKVLCSNNSVPREDDGAVPSDPWDVVDLDTGGKAVPYIGQREGLQDT